MSKLQSKLAKAGIEIPKDKPAKSSSKLATIEAPKDIKLAVDNYLAATDAENDAKARRADAAGKLHTFFLDRVWETKSTENGLIEGSTGAVNVIIKSQYSMKNPDGLREAMKACKLDYDRFVTEKTSIVIDFDALSEAETTKIITLIKSFGQDRAALLVQEQTKYEMSPDFLRELPRVGSRDAFDGLREASGHFTPTVSARKS